MRYKIERVREESLLRLVAESEEDSIMLDDMFRELKGRFGNKDYSLTPMSSSVTDESYKIITYRIKTKES